jgi:hypothetical protein
MATIPRFPARISFVKMVRADEDNVGIRVGEVAHCVSLSVCTKLEGRIHTRICC